MRKVFVVVPVIAIVVLVGGDLLVGSILESRLERSTQRRLGLTERPTVDLDGFPFVYHALLRRFPGASVEGRNLRIQGLPVDRFRLELRDVRLVPGDAGGEDGGSLRAGEGRGTVEVTEEGLRAYLQRRGVPLSVQLLGSSRARVAGTVRVLGFDVEASAEGVLSVTKRSLEFRPQRIKVGNGIDVPASALSFRVELPEPLPGVEYRDLTIERGRAILSFRIRRAAVPL